MGMVTRAGDVVSPMTEYQPRIRGATQWRHAWSQWPTYLPWTGWWGAV